MPVLAWFISLTLSRRGVRLSVIWVNMEWDSTSTESTHGDTPRQLSQCRRHQHLQRFYNPRWLSWHGVSLCVDSFDVESHFALTQLTRNETPRQLSHRRMLKKSNKSANSRTKSKKMQKPYYLAYMCLISAKKENKKSHASVPLIRPASSSPSPHLIRSVSQPALSLSILSHPTSRTSHYIPLSIPTPPPRSLTTQKNVVSYPGVTRRRFASLCLIWRLLRNFLHLYPNSSVAVVLDVLSLLYLVSCRAKCTFFHLVLMYSLMPGTHDTTKVMFSTQVFMKCYEHIFLLCDGALPVVFYVLTLLQGMHAIPVVLYST
jgi:hypothetical protein